MRHLPAFIALLLVFTLTACGQGNDPADGKLNVCATTPDLGAIAQAVGGDLVNVTVFVGGMDDPHDAQPSQRMAEDLVRADVLIEVGRDLEHGWLPQLKQVASRNGQVINNPIVAEAYAPEEEEQDDAAPASSGGHLHLHGNPHFLLDPVPAAYLAEAVHERFVKLTPADEHEALDRNLSAFIQELATLMLGDAGQDITTAEAFEQACEAWHEGELEAGGYLGAFKPYAGASLVVDHDLWEDFAHRINVEVIGSLEVEPGIEPSMAHMQELVQQVDEQDVQALLVAAYFPKRSIDTFRGMSEVQVAEMAHQVGGREGVDTYVKLLKHNCDALLQALESAAGE